MNTDSKINKDQALQEAKLKVAIEAGQKDWNTVLSNIYVNSLSWQSKIVLFNKYIDKAIRYCSENLLTLSSSKEKLDIKFICTRFAHQCRLKGVGTNDETCNLFNEWIKTQSFPNQPKRFSLEQVYKILSFVDGNTRLNERGAKMFFDGEVALNSLIVKRYLEEESQIPKEYRQTECREVEFGKWIVEKVSNLHSDDDWYKEGYRYMISVSPAQTSRVKTFQEVHKHFLNQLPKS